LACPASPASRKKTGEQKSRSGQLTDVSVAGKFCLLLQNAQGLASPSKVALFRDYILSLSAADRPHVILLTETWLNKGEAKAFCLPSYKTVAFFTRAQKLRGGVSILLKSRT
jgi:cystathionine beta-lyase/cystathionine gamma-synthase